MMPAALIALMAVVFAGLSIEAGTSGRFFGCVFTAIIFGLLCAAAIDMAWCAFKISRERSR